MNAHALVLSIIEKFAFSAFQNGVFFFNFRYRGHKRGLGKDFLDLGGFKLVSKGAETVTKPNLHRQIKLDAYGLVQ